MDKTIAKKSEVIKFDIIKLRIELDKIKRSYKFA